MNSDKKIEVDNKDSHHSLPLRETNIVLLLFELIITCRVSKYLICIADWEFRISEVYFNILADSTSALAEMMLASDTLFCIAADCIFFLVSSERIKSRMKIFSMKRPQVSTLCATQASISSATCFLFQSRSWKIVSPTTVLIAEQDISAMKFRISPKLLPNLQTSLQGLIVLQYTVVSILRDTLSLVITVWGWRFSTLVFMSTGMTVSVQGFIMWRPGLMTYLQRPKVCRMPILLVSSWQRGLPQQQQKQGQKILREPVQLPQHSRQLSQQVVSWASGFPQSSSLDLSSSFWCMYLMQLQMIIAYNQIIKSCPTFLLSSTPPPSPLSFCPPALPHSSHSTLTIFSLQHIIEQMLLKYCPS